MAFRRRVWVRVTNAVASTGWTLHFLTQQLRDAALSGMTTLLSLSHSYSCDPTWLTTTSTFKA